MCHKVFSITPVPMRDQPFNRSVQSSAYGRQGRTIVCTPESLKNMHSEPNLKIGLMYVGSKRPENTVYV